MLGICKYAQSWFYIEYSILTLVLSLRIKDCQLFRKFICEATHNRWFGLGLIDINEVNKRIVYMTYAIIIFFYRCLYDIVYDV